jgi:phenylacetate-CoA ligase
MLTKAIETIEHALLHLEPRRSVRFLNLSPRWATEKLRRARFRRTLRLAAERSSFYREEFKRRQINMEAIESPSQLGDFYTTGEDLRAHGPEAFLTGRPDTAFETTGTSSPIPKRVFFSNEELEEMGRCSALSLYRLGIRPEDRIFSAYDSSFWVSPVVLKMAVQYLKSFHVEAGKIQPLEFYERARAYRPNIIFGEPSWLLRFSEIAQQRGAWPMKFLFGGGENMAEEGRGFVEGIWNAPLYLSYGQTESFGTLGAECERKDGYHRNDLFFWFETPEVGEDGFGELVYTTLARNVMPLIRYRAADLTKLVDDRCPCGFFVGRLAKIRARCDEMVVCGMGNVGPWVFEELLRGVAGISNDWQAAVRYEGARDVIELRVEMTDGLSQSDIRDIVYRNLHQRFADFSKNLEMKLYDLRVVARGSGSLRGNARKLNRVVDERQMLTTEITRASVD